MAIAVGDHQHISTGVITLADLIPVHQRASQHHIGELWILERAVDRFAETPTERAHFDLVELVTVEVTARRPQQPAHQGPGTQGMPEGDRIEPGTAHRPRPESGGGQLPLADPP